jgi:antitoxin HicB
MPERFAFRARLKPAAMHDPHERGFIVTFPDRDWGVTQGESEADAQATARDRLEEMVVGQILSGGDIPIPRTTGPAERLVPIGALLAAKAALHQALRDAGIGPGELARRLGSNEAEARRLPDARQPIARPRLEAALHARGKRLLVGVGDAA